MDTLYDLPSTATVSWRESQVCILGSISVDTNTDLPSATRGLRRETRILDLRVHLAKQTGPVVIQNGISAVIVKSNLPSTAWTLNVVATDIVRCRWTAKVLRRRLPLGRAHLDQTVNTESKNRGAAMGKGKVTFSEEELKKLKAKLSRRLPVNQPRPAYVPKFVRGRKNAYDIPRFTFQVPFDDEDLAERRERDEAIAALYWKRRNAWQEKRQAELRRISSDAAAKELSAELNARFGNPELTIAQAIDVDTSAQRQWHQFDEKGVHFTPVFQTEETE